MSAPLCELRGLQVVIDSTMVCASLDLTVRAGECWAVLGMNGVGKTTLLHTMAGLRGAQSGEIRLLGTRLTELPRREIAKRLALMPQLFEDAFPATVFEEALAGRNPHLPPWGWESTEDELITRAALVEVGLAALASRLTTTLSGGERRRVQLACLLAQDAPLMLLDEPVNHLDLHRQVMLLKLVREKVSGKQRAAVMSLHDVNLAARYCDHVLLMFGTGDCASGTVAEMLTEDLLSRVYCHSLRVIEVDGRRHFVAA